MALHLLKQMKNKLWLAFRIAVLIGIIVGEFSRKSSVYNNPTLNQCLFLAAGGLIFSLFVGVWILIGRDDSINYSPLALFTHCPMWPIGQYVSSGWVFLGAMLVVSGTANSIRMSFVEGAFNTTAFFMNLITGIMFMIFSYLAYRWKRKKSQKPKGVSET